MSAPLEINHYTYGRLDVQFLLLLLLLLECEVVMLVLIFTTDQVFEGWNVDVLFGCALRRGGFIASECLIK